MVHTGGAIYLLASVIGLFVALRLGKSKHPNWEKDWISPNVLTVSELRRFDGKDGAKSYLTILGEIYDVTGSEHYRGDGGYSVFIAQDATQAFVTGQFNASAQDDVSAFTTTQMKAIEEWIEFYR